MAGNKVILDTYFPLPNSSFTAKNSREVENARDEPHYFSNSANLSILMVSS